MNVMAAEPELTKQKKVAPPVEEKTQPSVKPQPFNVEEIRKKIPKAFQGYLDPVIDWANSVEARFQVMEEEMPTRIVQKLQEVAVEARKKQRAAMTQTPQIQQPQGQGGAGLDGVLAQILSSGGGGGMDEDMKKRYNQMMDLQFERLQSDVSFTRTMENYVKSQFAAKMAKGVVEGLTK